MFKHFSACVCIAYEFKKMFPENVLQDLMAHSEDMAELGESDLGFVSSTVGDEIIFF